MKVNKLRPIAIVLRIERFNLCLPVSAKILVSLLWFTTIPLVWPEVNSTEGDSYRQHLAGTGIVVSRAAHAHLQFLMLSADTRVVSL